MTSIHAAIALQTEALLFAADLLSDGGIDKKQIFEEVTDVRNFIVRFLDELPNAHEACDVLKWCVGTLASDGNVHFPAPKGLVMRAKITEFRRNVFNDVAALQELHASTPVIIGGVDCDVPLMRIGVHAIERVYSERVMQFCGTR